MGVSKELPSVPRSKGCTACVKRRVKCDGRQPLCANCETRGRRCPGYRRSEFVFLNDGWKSHGIKSSICFGENDKNLLRPTQTKQGHNHNHHSTTFHQVPESRLVKAYRRTSRKGQDIRGNLGNPQKFLIPDKMSIYISSFVCEFSGVLSYIGHQGLEPQDDFLLQRLHPIWEYYTSHGETNPTRLATASAFSAAKALVKSYFSRAHGDSQLFQEAMTTYGIALNQMAETVKHMKTVNPEDLDDQGWEDILFSCLLLALYELTAHPASTNWQRHIEAVANMIKFRGPEGLLKGNGLNILSNMRIFIIFERLCTRQPTFLAEEAWKHLLQFHRVPQGFPDSAPDLQYLPLYGPQLHYESLLDEIAVIPGLLYTCDQVFEPHFKKSSILTITSTLNALQERIANAIHTVERVISSFSFGVLEVVSTPPSPERAKVHKSVPISISAHHATDSQGPIFDTVLYFHTIEHSNLMALTWSLAIILRMALSRLESHDYGEDASCHFRLRKQDASHDEALVTYARQILRSVDYSFLPQNLGCAPFYFSSPLEMAEVVMTRECDRIAGLCTEGGSIDVEYMTICLRQKEMARRCRREIERLKIGVGFDCGREKWP